MGWTSTLNSMADGFHAMQYSDYAVLPELLDLAQTISQLAKDLLRMLSEVWRRAVHLSINTRTTSCVITDTRGPTFILDPS